MADGRSNGLEHWRANWASIPPPSREIVTSLEQLGLVSRVSDDRDGRRRPVVLTEDGGRFMVHFHTEAHERESALTAALDPKSLEITMQVLHTLRDVLAPDHRRRR